MLFNLVSKESSQEVVIDDLAPVLSKFSKNISDIGKMLVDVFTMSSTSTSLDKSSTILSFRVPLSTDKKLISTIKPEKRYYHISKMVTTEAAIYHAFLQDYYLVLGDKTTDGWSIKLYQNPLVMLIWIGAFIMMLSGLIALRRK